MTPTPASKSQVPMELNGQLTLLMILADRSVPVPEVVQLINRYVVFAPEPMVWTLKTKAFE